MRRSDKLTSVPHAEAQVKGAATVTALCLLGDSALYVVLPLYYEAFGLTSLWEVGVLLAVNRFVRIPVHPLVKRMYRNGSVVRGYQIAIMLTVISILACGLLKHFWLLVVARALWGVAWSLLRQGGQLAVLQAMRGEERQGAGSLIGQFNGISRIGSLVGMVLGAVLTTTLGPFWMCVGFACAALPGVVLVQYGMRDQPAEDVDRQADDELPSSSAVSFRGGWKQLLLYTLLPGMLIAMLYQGLWKSTLGHWVVQQDFTHLLLLGGLSAAMWTALLHALRWGLEPIVAPWTGRAGDLPSMRSKLLVASLLAAALLFWLLPLSLPSVLWLIIVAGITFTAVTATTCMDAAATMAAHRMNTFHKRQTVIASYLIASDLGAAMGPLFGFVLIEYASIWSLLPLATLTLATAALLMTAEQLAVRKRDKKRSVNVSGMR